ncbi:hypothetical protein O181_030239 [Austropuccinia psidii MF-1]|uniref:Uncharacterized protein n=1 Tax=Austropuccinia psidii MF-1 TaxID=1389203 RepID=A0A9Q3H5D1_9BASI|nr:hypothetical protein [Austropuccinia psidii MF-1]
MAHGPWANQAPFGLPSRAKGGRALALKARPSGPPWTTFQPPDQLSLVLPLNLRGILSISPCTPYSRLQEWCIYGIIYHCAPCFAQQFNGDDFRTKVHYSNSRSQNPIPISKEDSSAHQYGIPWQVSEDYSRTPITWPCKSCVGSSIQDYSKRDISQEDYILSISCQGSKYFSIPWTIQMVHTGNTQVYCMALARLGQFIPTVAIQSHSSFSKMDITVLAQFRQYSR